jgi:hypothetical protein
MTTATTPFVLDQRNRDYVLGAGPRPKTSGSAMVFGLAFVSIFVGVGLFILATAGYEWYDSYRFGTAAVAGDAKVEGTSVSTDSDGDDTYYVSYSYAVTVNGDPAAHIGQASIGAEEYGRLNPGDRLAIVYLRDEPGRSRLANVGAVRPLFLTGFGLIWTALSGFMFAGMGMALQRQRLVEQRGQLVPAMITDYATRVDSDDDLIVSVTYEFYSPAGRRLSGSTQRVRNDLKGQPAPALPCPGAVLYVDERIHSLL